MNPREAKKLGAFVRSARETRSLSQNRLGEAVGVPNTTIMRLERGENLKPRADLLASIADELGINLADIYGLAGYDAPTALPSLRPYLRSKYRQLPAEAGEQLERYAERLAKRHGVDLNGPAPGEDEEPEVTRISTSKRSSPKQKGGMR
jgi:transcriptional regulator with XRE-family HTH domain